VTTTPVTTTPAPAPGSIETSAFRSVGDASTPVGTSLQGTGPSSKAIADVTGSNSKSTSAFGNAIVLKAGA
jgi:hypothetical protein